MEKLIKLIREGYNRDSLVRKVMKPITDKEKLFPKPKKEATGDGEKYKEFFMAALKKFGVNSPAELKGDKELEFYDYIDKNWKADHEESVTEELKVSDGLGAWITDFHKSDAPQFTGKSKEERQKMAIAAFVAAGGKLESVKESVGTNGQSLEADEMGRGLSPKAQFVKSMLNPEVAADANKAALQTFAEIMNSVSIKGAPRPGDNTEQDNQ